MLDKASFRKTVFAFLLPMAIQNLINVAISSTDVIMLGRYSEVALSASSLASQIQFILILLLFGIGSGATWEEAAKIANAAGGIVVGKIGTSTVSEKELIETYNNIYKEK